MVTTEQISSGLVKFIEGEMLKGTMSDGTRFVVTLAKNALRLNPDTIARVMRHPVVSMLIPCEDGKFDIKSILPVLKETFQEAGNFKVKLPKVPLLLPEGEEITFDADDVSKLVMYVEEA